MNRLIMIQTTRTVSKIFVNPEYIIKCVQRENEYTISLQQEGTYEITKESFNSIMKHFSADLIVDTTNITVDQVLSPEPSTDSFWIDEQKKLIKEFRKEHKINQTDFAIMCSKLESIEKCSQYDISLIERGLKHFSVQQWKEVKDLIDWCIYMNLQESS